MQVVLKVVGGKNDGREIVISVPKFIIGRGETAHLRPSSDLISREHCSICIRDGQVTVDDMNSSNGTFINGTQLTGTHSVKSGDSLRVGRLQFNILIDPVKAGNKKPRVNSAVEAASRTMEEKRPNKEAIEDSITDWLAAPEEVDPKQSFPTAETVQFTIEDSTTKENLDLDESSDSSSENLVDPEMDESDEKKQSKKKNFGKLPPRPKFSHDDSTTAAGDVLKKFFNRR